MDRLINLIRITSIFAVIILMIKIYLLTNELEKDIRNEIEEEF